MSLGKPRLVFVSPLFLFPNDAGGKIRTTNILRGMKGGAFEITLLAPATLQQQTQWSNELAGVCDRFVRWEPRTNLPQCLRVAHVMSRLPINVVADRYRSAVRCVQDTLRSELFDVAVFDFVHASVLLPADVEAATVCFTHNVEAEIFKRHSEQAATFFMRRLWRSQYMKMQEFERDSLRRYKRVISVSDRDAAQFRQSYGLDSISVIPTGVDLDFFKWQSPPDVGPENPPTVIFTGSMDWSANVDGVANFIEQVWPRVRAAIPAAQFVVVGRNPPGRLVSVGQQFSVKFTGFVDDVRTYVHSAHVFVIPLRVGGGTRIKAFEAMAMGCPVVSTTIGMEGLDVIADLHYLERDEAAAQADAIVALLLDRERRMNLSIEARRCVEDRFGHRVAAKAFEQICVGVVPSYFLHA